MAEANMEIPEDHDYPTLDHMIIWLDDHIGKAGEYQRLKNAFASNLDPRCQTWTMLTDPEIDNLLRTGEAIPVRFAGVLFHLLAFDNPIRCYHAFERYKDKHIYFITSGTLGKYIVPMLIENYKQLFIDPITKRSYYSIYIFCGNTEYHYEWLFDALEYAQTFNHEADLLTRMTGDVANYFVKQGERNLQNALLRYQWAKKVFDQFTKMGENCTSELRNVERRTADIESILTPQVSNPHVNRNNVTENNNNENNDDNEERSSQACS